jgi:hypothetical protein
MGKKRKQVKQHLPAASGGVMGMKAHWGIGGNASGGGGQWQCFRGGASRGGV